MVSTCIRPIAELTRLSMTCESSLNYFVLLGLALLRISQLGFIGRKCFSDLLDVWDIWVRSIAPYCRFEGKWSLFVTKLKQERNIKLRFRLLGGWKPEARKVLAVFARTVVQSNRILGDNVYFTQWCSSVDLKFSSVRGRRRCRF